VASMDDDPLKEYVNSLGLDGQAYEALRNGDVQTLIWNMLSEQISDPLLATVLQFMLAQNHRVFTQTAGPDEARQHSPQRGRYGAMVSSPDNAQLDTTLATLRHVARMLGACPACCGEEPSCPKCHGSGKPGSAPSAVSAEEFRAWIEPALGRMGMRIADLALADESLTGDGTQALLPHTPQS
jgi:hypothetical protein